jgi:hypothetical protein
MVRLSGVWLRALTLSWVSMLLGAMILAQTLGLIHAYVHAPHTQRAGVVAGHDHQARATTDADGHAHVWSEALFAGHDDGSNSCRVFDQQGHSAPMMALASLVLPSVLRALVPPAAIACKRISSAAPFEARAPPSSL